METADEMEFEQHLKNAAEVQKNIAKQLEKLKACVLNGQDVESLYNKEELSIPPDLLIQAFGENIEAALQVPKGTIILALMIKKVTLQFKEILGIMEKLVQDLGSLVDKWKGCFQLYYAKLMAEPDLEHIAQWCAETGKIIYGLLHVSITDWKHIMQNAGASLESVDEIEKNLRTLFTGFYQRTFIVSKQESFYVKTENKKMPEFTVRVLAADYLHNLTSDVTIYFGYENDLKKCFHGDDLDLKTLEEKQIRLNFCKKKMSDNKPKLETEKNKTGKNKMQCCIQNLKFEKPFKRGPAKKIPVHEEKFRMVFVTKMESKLYWTVSLPLVVISASSQEANSLASIMWQCASTNVFSLKETTPDKLPWSFVVKMLCQKMAMICETHKLTEENMNHLKYRMFGSEEELDEEEVSLTKFCCNTMQGVDFSFWKWFLGVYNLTEQHLQQYWSEGLIMGFVKKEHAEQLLKERGTCGMFIVRFSDKCLTDSDGLKKVLGQVTTCVCLKKDIKPTTDSGIKRKSNLEAEETSIEHYQFVNNPPKNLANKLKKTPNLYCKLYPSGRSREETFDKYIIEKKRNLHQFYKSSKDADDLEQELRQMNISQKNEQTSSSGCILETESRTVKKARRCNKTHDSENILANQLLPVSEQKESLLNLSQNSWLEQSPGGMEGSPAQSVPNGMIPLTVDVNEDCIVPISSFVQESENFEIDFSLEFGDMEMPFEFPDEDNENMNSVLNTLDVYNIPDGEFSANVAVDTTVQGEETNKLLELEENNISEGQAEGSAVIEPVSQLAGNQSAANDDLDQDLKCLMQHYKKLKEVKPAECRKFCSWMEEEIVAMKTETQNASVDKCTSEDIVENTDSESSLESIMNIDLQSFEEMIRNDQMIF